eukprot:9473494-Pyramimonas_sp.AAC.1
MSDRPVTTSSRPAPRPRFRVETEHLWSARISFLWADVIVPLSIQVLAVAIGPRDEGPKTGSPSPPSIMPATRGRARAGGRSDDPPLRRHGNGEGTEGRAVATAAEEEEEKEEEGRVQGRRRRGRRSRKRGSDGNAARRLKPGHRGQRRRRRAAPISLPLLLAYKTLGISWKFWGLGDHGRGGGNLS